MNAIDVTADDVGPAPDDYPDIGEMLADLNRATRARDQYLRELVVYRHNMADAGRFLFGLLDRIGAQLPAGDRDELLRHHAALVEPEAQFEEYVTRELEPYDADRAVSVHNAAGACMAWHVPLASIEPSAHRRRQISINLTLFGHHDVGAGDAFRRISPAA